MPHLLEIPHQLPLLVLSDTILFPQAMLPFYVIEDKKIQLLEDVLKSNRLIALSCQAASVQEQSFSSRQSSSMLKSCSPMGTLALIRLCYRQPDGRALVIFQGLERIRILKVMRNRHYLKAEIQPSIQKTFNLYKHVLLQLKEELIPLIKVYNQQSPKVSEDMFERLLEIEDPGVFLDILSSYLCDDLNMQQKLLHTVNKLDQYSIFTDYIRTQLSNK